MLPTAFWIRLPAPLIAGMVMACSGPDSAARIEARWVGSDTGAFAGTPKVTWCGSIQRLEITVVDGNDAGVGLALYPLKELRAGRYEAFDPGIDSVRRPGVAAASRYFTEQAVKGFQSDSGELELERSGTTFSASFGFRMRSLEGRDTVRLTGRFHDAVPGPCPGDTTTALAP